VTFFTDLAAFNAAAGTPPVALDFEDITTDQKDITSPYGYTIRGVKFDRGAGTAPLVVVRGSETFTPPGFDGGSGVVDPATNKLFPTSGQYVLSPGGAALVPGPDPGQEDGLQLTFGPAVSAVGFDVLFQSLFEASFTEIQVLGPSGETLFGPTPLPFTGPKNGPGGSGFVGFVSTSANIAQIIVVEFDRDNVHADANIGYDTFRFPLAGTPVNDNLATATDLVTFPTPLLSGSTATATTEVGEPANGCGPTSRTVWYRIQPTQDGVLTASTQGDPRFAPVADTVLTVFRGTSLGGLVEVACDDDSGPGRTDLVSTSVTQGQTYYLQVSSYYPTSGPFRLQVSLTP
jgi:hypothetical protein